MSEDLVQATGDPVSTTSRSPDHGTRVEVKIAHELLNSVENLAKRFLGERSMPIPPEMALILISAYRKYLSNADRGIESAIREED